MYPVGIQKNRTSLSTVPLPAYRRHTKSKAQLDLLHKWFQENPNPSSSQYIEYAQISGLEKDQIRSWFSNSKRPGRKPKSKNVGGEDGKIKANGSGLILKDTLDHEIAPSKLIPIPESSNKVLTPDTLQSFSDKIQSMLDQWQEILPAQQPNSLAAVNTPASPSSLEITAFESNSGYGIETTSSEDVNIYRESPPTQDSVTEGGSLSFVSLASRDNSPPSFIRIAAIHRKSPDTRMLVEAGKTWVENVHTKNQASIERYIVNQGIDPITITERSSIALRNVSAHEPFLILDEKTASRAGLLHDKIYHERWHRAELWRFFNNASETENITLLISGIDGLGVLRSEYVKLYQTWPHLHVYLVWLLEKAWFKKFVPSQLKALFTWDSVHHTTRISLAELVAEFQAPGSGCELAEWIGTRFDMGLNYREELGKIHQEAFKNGANTHGRNLH